MKHCILLLNFICTVIVIVADTAEAGHRPVVIKSAKHDTGLPLKNLKPCSPAISAKPEEIPIFKIPHKQKRTAFDPGSSFIQDWHFPWTMPETEQNFEGISNVNKRYPPDTQGDVGHDHYVQIVNLSFAIWDKQGNQLFGPADNNTVWQDFGGPCEETNHGDPIVLYDHLADRWLLTRFAHPNGKYAGPFYQCIAVSKTPDPTKEWHRYEFKISDTKFNDYPKFGVWPDGYYMSVNQFKEGRWAGGGAVA
ncbi:MAG: hypothetical protein GY795_18685, partial [Desulfobacterales bacterium]|nr:hypothetical protein [Desulfobacterales bacterium]